MAGSLTPRSQEQLVHLAAWMPFARAVTMLGRLTGVQISEATARRHSYQIGAAQEVLQQVAPAPADQLSTPAAKAIISVDGAMVPLLKGKWAEVKTVVGKETGETAHVERWNNTLR